MKNNILVISDAQLALIRRALGIAENSYTAIQTAVTGLENVRGCPKSEEPLIYHIKASEFAYLNSDLDPGKGIVSGFSDKTGAALDVFAEKMLADAKCLSESYAKSPGEGDAKWGSFQRERGRFLQLIDTAADIKGEIEEAKKRG